MRTKEEAKPKADYERLGSGSETAVRLPEDGAVSLEYEIDEVGKNHGELVVASLKS